MDVREKLVEILKQAPFEGKVLDEWWWEEKIKRIADHLIAHNVTVQEWIPVTERLPEKSKDVLVYSNKNGGYMFFGYRGYISGNWMEWGALHIGDVTHWMPIPQPPKGE